MMRAHAADPRNPDVLLALGVSHTNELSQWEAVRHLRSWLGAQPQHAAMEAAAGEAPDTSQRLSHTVGRAAAHGGERAACFVSGGGPE